MIQILNIFIFDIYEKLIIILQAYHHIIIYFCYNVYQMDPQVFIK